MPAQTNKDVYLRTEDAHTTYVVAFGGFAAETDVTKEVRAAAPRLTYIFWAYPCLFL